MYTITNRVMPKKLHMLYLSGSNLTMLMKWVTLMVGLSKAVLSSSAGRELVKVQVADG